MAHQPDQVAGYRVIARLGSGGMGTVYLVENPQLRRREALKVISVAETVDEEFARRFSREAQTAAALDHPSIVTIYHYGVTDGDPWFTMTYLDGQDLRHTSLRRDEIATVVARVADALDYAHDHGVVHRDIKPANILVTRRAMDGALDRVVVLDFGIAKLTTATTLTAPSSFVGTLVYAAPEILDGKPAGPASDQYSLACTAYELLAGTTPFEADTQTRHIVAKLTTPPDRISAHRPELAALDPVFDRALARGPLDRYPTCRAFAEDLRAALAVGGPDLTDKHSESSATQIISTPRPHPPAPETLAPPHGPPRHDQRPGFQPTPSGTQHLASPPGITPPLGAYSQTGTQVAPPPASSRERPRRWPLIVGAVSAVVLLAVAAAIAVSTLRGGTDDGAGSVAAADAAAEVALSAGLGATCSIRDQVAYCWGSNDAGQIGDGTTTSHPTPTRVADLANVTSISTGGPNSCAVADATAYCWGNNDYGQIGDGTTDARLTPTRVADLTDVTAISTANWATCAISAGAAYCWGTNDFDQVGDGSTANQHRPVRVAGLDDVTAITVGVNFTCAVAAGDAYCWGLNDKGQVGDGTTTNRPRPTRVADLDGATAVSAGAGTACAVAGGSAYCWGANDFGQLGEGSTYARETATAVPDLTDVTAISTGTSSTTCAIAGGTAYCWGSNAWGSVGDGTLEDRWKPTPVTGLSDVGAISTGERTSCASAASNLYCWGFNATGQLGVGGSDDRPTPTQVTY
ncbi:protein kinase [Gordonia jinghuaiqii]|uniref:Protein kinase n=1 Tax=Gordonia jinghuaiqii TaxID=2758710 RepID=A0A7D7LUP1_9ACTN|nr:protein kinase [Gordonia jinghuaiqii]MCR5980621.1 protein kinase [Gordonia jinghuaiqii]QMT02677.1 protein kinase [Gordonia jinghuaiqii]